MNLMSLVQGFMASKLERHCEELAEKYGVPENELSEIVESFLRDTYGPAVELAEAISSKELPVLLFIGRKDCAICKRSLPELESFLQRHADIELFKQDYTQPAGLLYHVIQNEETGMLPLIAIIFRGCILMLFTGVCVDREIYERYYRDLNSVCSQNI